MQRIFFVSVDIFARIACFLSTFSLSIAYTYSKYLQFCNEHNAYSLFFKTSILFECSLQCNQSSN